MTGPKRPLLIALVASVMLNLFLLGFGAARWFGHPPHGGPFGWRGMSPHALGGGPPRELFRKTLGKRRDAVREQRQQLRNAQRAVRSALAAEPLDPAALEHALERLRQTTSDSQRLMHEAIVEVAPILTRNERLQLARNARMLGGFFNRD